MTRIALVQLASPYDESQEERISRVEGMLLERDGENIEMFVLPELWSAGYLAFKHYEELSESLDGPTVTMCRRVAQKLGAWVHVGSFIERDEEGTATYVEHHRTMGDRVRELVGAGFVLEDVIEPEWPDDLDVTWGQWSPLRGAVIPGTAIFVARLAG